MTTFLYLGFGRFWNTLDVLAARLSELYGVIYQWVAISKFKEITIERILDSDYKMKMADDVLNQL